MPPRRAGSAPAPTSGTGSCLGRAGGPPHFRCALGFRQRIPVTRAHVRLLGPCFKTGRVEHRPIRHRPFARRLAHPADAPAPRLPRTARGSGDGSRTCEGRPGTETTRRILLGPAASPLRLGCKARRTRVARTAPSHLPVAEASDRRREPVVALRPEKVHPAAGARSLGGVTGHPP